MCGGGNFTNLYSHSEKCRMDIISTWKDNKKIVFPQTIFFTNDKQGQQFLEQTKKVYVIDNNVVLTVREKFSYEFANKNYTCKIKLIPDIVLYNTGLDCFSKRENVLFVLRDDKEKLLTVTEEESLKNLVEEFKLNIDRYDLQYTREFDREQAKTELQHVALIKYKKAKLVITDRLHGMIVAAITGTPCIAFSNNNYKIEGSSKWLEHLPYIKFVANVNDLAVIKKYAKELLELKETKYDNSNLMPYFKEIVELIKEKDEV